MFSTESYIHVSLCISTHSELVSAYATLMIPSCRVGVGGRAAYEMRNRRAQLCRSRLGHAIAQAAQADACLPPHLRFCSRSGHMEFVYRILV
jgi:hypothetical protein